jgi:hypothetical protein
VTAVTDVLTPFCYICNGKEVAGMKIASSAGPDLTEKGKDQKFLRRVNNLKAWVQKKPYDFDAHNALSALYLSKNMFAEAEFEQEIMEWLDRIKRSVKLNAG